MRSKALRFFLTVFLTIAICFTLTQCGKEESPSEQDTLPSETGDDTPGTEDQTPENTQSEGSTPEVKPDPVEADIYVPYVTSNEEFIRGTDVSTLLANLRSGAVYRDWDGNPLGDTVEEQGAAFMRLLAESGVNWVRLRVWNDPYDKEGHGYGGGNNDLEATITMGKWATDAGIRVLIDFHYSDFWADPGRQLAPKAWAGMSVDEKASALYKYTEESLNALLDAGVDVGMVQVGNETNNGVSDVLFATDGWAQVCKLFSAGCDATHAVADARGTEILAAIHFTEPHHGEYPTYAQNLQDNGVDYDVFASSYYPYWHGTLSNLTTELGKVAEGYGKKVMVAETSWAFTLEDGDGNGNTVGPGSNDTSVSGENYPVSAQGQALAYAAVANAVHNVGDAGLGLFYWENAWIPVQNAYPDGVYNESIHNSNWEKWEEFGSGWASSYAYAYDPVNVGTYYGGSAWDNQSMFDFDGKPMASLNVFKYLTTGTTGYEDEIIMIESLEVEIVAGGTLNLPATARATHTDMSVTVLVVDWDEDSVAAADTNTPGTYIITGKDRSGEEDVTCTVTVTAVSILPNSGFEGADTSMYTISDPMAAITTDDPHKGSNSLHFWHGTAPVVFTAEQTITLEPGEYVFSIFGQGGDVGDGADTHIYAVIGDTTVTQSFELTGWQNWQNPKLSFTVTETTEVTVGVSVNAAPGAWGTFDDWALYPL